MYEDNYKKWRAKTDIEAVGKGLRYAFENRGISEKLLKEYSKNFTDDGRYRIHVIVMNKLRLTGICKYKNEVYKFKINTDKVDIEKIIY